MWHASAQVMFQRKIEPRLSVQPHSMLANLPRLSVLTATSDLCGNTALACDQIECT